MKKIYCPECKHSKEIIGFKRDDPILECGHIKLITNSIEGIFEEIFHFIMEKEDLTYEEVGELPYEEIARFLGHGQSMTRGER